MNKKLLSTLLIATLLCSITTSTAFAAEATAPGDATSAAVLTADATLFSVTVPTSVLIYVKSNGDVITPDTIPITNNSAGPVMVSNIAVTTKNGWTLDSTATDYTHFKVGRKNFKMTLNGQDPSAGALTLNTPINGSESLNLAFGANVSPQKEAITATQIAEMVVTVGWYADETAPVGGNYLLASDSDFSGDADGDFRYIGTAEHVIMPETIKGISVTSYSSLFYNSAVKGVVSENPNITDMSNMFYAATSNELELDLNTTNVTNMSSMFAESQALALDLTSFSTSNVTDMSSMFANSAALVIDTSTFDTSHVVDMNMMYLNSKATTLNLSNFNTSSVTDMGMIAMFNNAEALALDLTSFDISGVTYLNNTFRGSKATTIDLSTWDTTNVAWLQYTFTSAATTTVYVRTSTDADKLSTSSSKPAGLVFTVK